MVLVPSLIGYVIVRNYIFAIPFARITARLDTIPVGSKIKFVACRLRGLGEKSKAPKDKLILHANIELTTNIRRRPLKRVYQKDGVNISYKHFYTDNVKNV